MVPKTTHHTGHHEFFEGVIYDTASSSASEHTKFYIRPKNTTLHRDVIVVRDHQDNRVSETGHVRSRRAVRTEVVRPDTVDDITHALFEAHPEK